MSANVIRWELRVKILRFVSFFLIVVLSANTEAMAQNFWKPTNGPYEQGRIVWSLAINDSGHIFAGTFGGGVFRSVDNGNTWIPANNGLINPYIYALAINLKGQIFAGTFGSKVFRSDDNGAIWNSKGTGFSTLFALSLAINNLSGEVFAGTGLGVFRSSNDGEMWEFLFNGLTTPSVYSIAINDSGHIFAGTLGGGVFRSTNNGESWTPVNTGLASFFILSLAINSQGHIFAGTDGDGIFRSKNNGDTWGPVNNGLTNPNVRALIINSKGHLFAGTGGGGVFLSKDDGQSWTPINNGLTNTNIRSLAINNSNGDIFAGTLGDGVFRSIHPLIVHQPSSLQPSGQPILIQADITDLDTISATLSYRRGGDKRFTSITMSDNGTVYQGVIPADVVTSRGVEYFIVASNSRGFTNLAPSSGIFSIQMQVSGETKSNVQPNGSAQTAYRLISVPLDLENKDPRVVLEDDLGQYKKSKWRFYELLNDQPQTYAELPNTSLMTPGKAFWLIVKEAGKFIDTGSGKSIPADKKYAIPLHPRWNFVGNPFNFSIPVDSIRLKSTGKPPALRSHEGKWNVLESDPVKEMKPLEGYAVAVEANDTLIINPDLTDTTASLSKSLLPSMQENIQWSIRILAQCQDAIDEDNRAAIVSGASTTWDDLDQPEPPVIGEYVSVYFPHPEWNKLAKNYCTDVRPMTSDDGLPTSDGEIWPFEVKTNIRDKVNLTFEGVDEVPPELEIWLVDDALKITQNLREQGQYAVAGAGHPKQLKLVVGKHGFVDEKLAEARAIPTTYELSQNFPNPFNPATTIRYGLPGAERVTLKIYNLLGAEVATLVDNEQKPAGYHAVVWDAQDGAGRNVTSGVYFIRMRAGNFVQTRKTLLIE